MGIGEERRAGWRGEIYRRSVFQEAQVSFSTSSWRHLHLSPPRVWPSSSMDGFSHPSVGPSPEEPGSEEVGKPKDRLEQGEERVGLMLYYSDELLDAKRKVEQNS